MYSRRIFSRDSSICSVLQRIKVMFLAVKSNVKRKEFAMPKRGENIYKRKDGRWEGRIQKKDMLTGKNKYQSIYGKTYKEIREKMILARQAQNISFCRMPFGNAAQLWLQTKKKEWKPGTYAFYCQLVTKYIIPCLQDIAIDKINNQIMEEFAMRVRGQKPDKPLSNNYLFQICATVCRIMAFVNKKYEVNLSIPNNPVTRKKNGGQVELPDEHSLILLEKYLISHCQEDTCLGILIAFHTGIRIGELSALKWKDINVDEGIVSIRRNLIRIKGDKNGFFDGTGATQIVEQAPKTFDSVRMIPLPPKIVTILRVYKKPDTEYVISGVKNPWAEPRTIQYRFKRILAKCNLEYFNFHMLRHSFATRCVSMGLDIKSLSELLGHSDVKVTLNLYVHSTMQQKRKLMERYNFLFYQTSNLPSVTQ